MSPAKLWVYMVPKAQTAALVVRKKKIAPAKVVPRIGANLGEILVATKVVNKKLA